MLITHGSSNPVLVALAALQYANVGEIDVTSFETVARDCRVTGCGFVVQTAFDLVDGLERMCKAGNFSIRQVAGKLTAEANAPA